VPEPDCAAVILAAGASTRLGQPKQLLLHQGETLLRRAARSALEAGCMPVIVVLGHEPERMRHAIAGLPVTAIENPHWQTGMGSSLRCGVQAAMDASPALLNLLLMVSDQPRLNAQVLRDLLATHAAANQRITAARYSGRLGVPAIFPIRLSAELMAVQGDQGARSVLQTHAAHVTPMDWPDGAFDVDTAADAARMQGAQDQVG
jgi:molybdenum cofactor cytidylyltransferase